MGELTDLKLIDEQIAKLLAQKNLLLESRRKDVLQELRKTIQTFGFTVAELGLSAASAPRKAGKVAKYANPDNPNETWHGGKGPKPKWVRAKLAEGLTLESFLVQPREI